jgi:hypothetical protein
MNSITARRVERVAVIVLIFTGFGVGLQALATPRSFYDSFPLGRGWVALDGPFNEHLVRDVGGLFVALGIVTALAWARQELRQPVAIAWFVQGTAHLVYHAAHLSRYGTADKIANIASLAIVPIAASVLFLSNRQMSTR